MRLIPVLVVVAALSAACGTSASTADPAPAATSSSSAAASSAPSSSGSSSAPAASPSSAPPSADVQRLSITVKGSSVTGDTGTVDVRLGRPVELTVTSDVADEVHVHGVDIGKDVPAGGSVVIDFTQTAPGRFEVELESRKRVLTRLQVS